jgi:hypothetical protein
MGLAAEAGGDGAIDPDEVYQMIWPRSGHQGECLAHDEQSNIQNILTDLDWEFVIVAHNHVDEYYPEPSVIEHRVRQALWFVAPRIVHRLQLRGGSPARFDKVPRPAATLH